MLGDVGQEMLADYAKAGGGILLLSGDRTYGQADFRNPNFVDLLPATFKKGGDYGRLPDPSPLTAAGKHPVLRGLKLSAKAVVLYAHDVLPTADAVTLLTYADGRPAVLASPEGKVRVALVTALPFGNAPAGRELYFRAPPWHQFLANLIRWIDRKP